MADVVRLRELVELQRGQSYKSALLDLPGPALLGLGTIKRNGGFQDGGLRTYGGESPERILLRPGDLYLSLKDITHAADLLGAVARVPGSIDVGRLTQDTIRLDLISGQVLPEYLYWALQTPKYRSYCRLRGTGTTNLDLSREDFLSYDIDLPSRREQRAIAEVLGALDDKIAANSKSIALIASYLATAFDRATSDDDVLTMVAEIADFHNRRRVPLSAREREYRPGAVPYYGATGQFGYVDQALFDEELVLVGEDGSVVTDAGTPVVQYIWGPSWVNNHAHVLTGIGISTELLFLAMQRGDIRPLVTGAVQPKVSMGNLKRLPLRLPAKSQRERLEETVSSQMALHRSLSDQSRTLAASRDTLLPQLMSGRLRVKDAETIAEAVL